MYRSMVSELGIFEEHGSIQIKCHGFSPAALLERIPVCGGRLHIENHIFRVALSSFYLDFDLCCVSLLHVFVLMDLHQAPKNGDPR